MSTTLHSDSDVDSSKTLLAQQQHWLQKLIERIQNGQTYISQKHQVKQKQSAGVWAALQNTALT